MIPSGSQRGSGRAEGPTGLLHGTPSTGGDGRITPKNDRPYWGQLSEEHVEDAFKPTGKSRLELTANIYQATL